MKIAYVVELIYNNVLYTEYFETYKDAENFSRSLIEFNIYKTPRILKCTIEENENVSYYLIKQYK